MRFTKVMTMVAIAANLSIFAIPAVHAEDKPYTVTNGKELDAHSYKGWKLFRNWCARCHGTFAQGMVGPNLADSLKVLTKEQFEETVTNGKTGQIGSMPAWKSNPQVMKDLGAIYAYLKARSDGAIGEVPPKKAK